MKKQVFLLTLASLFAGFQVKATTNSCASSCDSSSSCASSCDSSKSCDLSRMDHNQTFMAVVPNWQAASPELVALSGSTALANLNKDDKHGQFQVSVFGGKTADKNAASYYFPAKCMTFDGSITSNTFASVLAESSVQTPAATAINDYVNVGALTATTTSATGSVTGAFASNATAIGNLAMDPATYKYDSNRDVSKILPWNFGITYAALFEPRGSSALGKQEGTGLITAPAFKSTIAPKLTRSHIGAGLALRYHFSDEPKGFFGTITTAVQHVRSRINLNEDVITAAEVISGHAAANPFGTATPAATTALGNDANDELFHSNAVSTVAPVGSILTSYTATSGFPGTGDVTAPANVTEAFDQAAWNYGKIGCEQRATRLADIEIALGYQWFCGDCASTNWYVGAVLPTGNRNCAKYVAPATVGNGFHFGIMTGSTTEVMLKEEDNYSTSYRFDINGRYLFRNTQKRSFDLVDNGFSRYMMVYEDEAAYTKALTASVGATAQVSQHTYTPGINVFTTDMRVTPGFQLRLNQALFVNGEHFKAEFGWNTQAREEERVKLACAWDKAPAFADASYVGGTALNPFRTINNDSQLTAINVIDSLNRGVTLANASYLTSADATALSAAYSAASIKESDIDLRSAASKAIMTNAPYLSLGYAFDCDYKPQVSVGASYEFSAGNAALNQWLVWGKFEVAF